MVEEPIKFIADKVKITGPKHDGSFTVSFETGEYGWSKIKDLPDLNGKVLKIQVESEDYSSFSRDANKQR